MVRCQKCGAQNAEDAEYCTACGAQLYAKPRVRRDDCFGLEGREKECFGLPYGGAIIGVIFGLLVIFIGVSIVFRWNIWLFILPAFVIIIGVLIIAGSIYGITRRR